MRQPFYTGPEIAASGTDRTGPINLVKTRKLSITFEVTFGGSIDADAEIEAFYSPDGNNWDNLAFASWAITFTVSTTRRITKIIDVPEHGKIEFKITNGSSADTLTNPRAWYSIQSWDKEVIPNQPQ